MVDDVMQLFSYHVLEAPAYRVMTRLLRLGKMRRVPGLLHAEQLLQMKMGHAVFSPGRYQWRSLVFIALWDDESSLDAFLDAPPYREFTKDGYHVRMRAYRRWGTYRGLDQAELDTVEQPKGQVVGLTLARLKLWHTFRFARWGKPVEEQVRDHPGLVHGAVAYRPFNTFSTFSIWENEEAMLAMVRGRTQRDGSQHRKAMIERARRPFHFEFMTLRLIPLSQHGPWPSR